MQHFELNKEYKIKKVSITQALAWWCNNNEINNLLDEKDYFDIINKYKEYIKNKQILYNDDDLNMNS